MKLIVLIDNRPHPTLPLETEHGLSFYLEADGARWLFDVGASGGFLRNAAALGIPVPEVDHLVLSHAHADHTGGLEAFLSVNGKADIYLSGRIAGQPYYSTRRGYRKDISIDYALLDTCRARIRPVFGNVALSASLTVLADIPAVYSRPKGNAGLLAGETRDDFSHEMALQVGTADGTCILSSCSHRGVLNTLAASAAKDIKAYVGGMHLLDSDAARQYESAAELQLLSGELRKKYPGIKIYTGHCTGEQAIAAFSRLLGDDFAVFHSGCRIF